MFQVFGACRCIAGLSVRPVTTMPIVLVRLVTRLRATALATYLCSRAIFCTRAAVLALTRGLFRKALETVEWDTPALRAMSLMEIMERMASRKPRAAPQEKAA